jgi:hypothetical protein
MNEKTTRAELGWLWRKILRTDPSQLFDSDAPRLQNRSWGDQLAQPGYVGRDYKSGGLAFVSMNPGGGRAAGLGSTDLRQYEALIRLRDCDDAEIGTRYDALTDVLEEIMPAWSIIQRFVEPILLQTATSFRSIAYFNLLKWRTSTSNNLSDLYDISWREHTSEQLRLLRPNVVIAVGVDVGKAFRRHCADSPHFDVIPRVIGNNIGEPGKEAIRRICVWLSEHPVSTFAAKHG